MSASATASELGSARKQGIKAAPMASGQLK